MRYKALALPDTVFLQKPNPVGKQFGPPWQTPQPESSTRHKTAITRTTHMKDCNPYQCGIDYDGRGQRTCTLATAQCNKIYKQPVMLRKIIIA